MLILKFFKILLLIIVAFLFISVVVLFQLNNTLHNTLFSYKYFEENFDRNITAENIEKFVDKAIQDLGKDITEGGENNEGVEMIKDSIDVQWVTGNIPKLIKDIFSYLTANSEIIPPLDLVPLKETVVNTAKTIIMKEYEAGSENEIEEIFKNIREEIKKDRVAKDKLINEFMNDEEFKDIGISREVFESVIEEIENRDDQEITGKEIIGLLLDEVIKEKMSIEQMKDELDLHLLLENIYGSENNPVTGVRNLVNNLRDSSFTINVIIMVLLLLIIIAAVYYPKSILRWTGICLILAGGVYLVTFAAEIVINPIIINKFGEAMEGAKGLDILFVQDFILSFIKGIINFMLMQALVIIALGILMIIISFFIKKRSVAEINVAIGQMENRKKPSKSNAIIVLVRALAVAALMIAIALSIMKYYGTFNSEVAVFNEINESTKSSEERTDIKEALDKTLNSKLFSSLGEL